MGAWSYELFSNDIALDVDERIEYLMKKKGLSLIESIDDILNNKHNRECAECVLAIGEIELERLGKIVHKKEIKEALIRELTPKRLRRWGKNLAMRESVLQQFGVASGLLSV